MYDKKAIINNSSLFINLKTKKPAKVGRFVICFAEILTIQQF